MKAPDELHQHHSVQYRCMRLAGWLEFNVHFQHKYGYIRDGLLHASPAFSTVNLIIIDIRSSLLVSNVSSLTFVQLHVIPLLRGNQGVMYLAAETQTS